MALNCMEEIKGTETTNINSHSYPGVYLLSGINFISDYYVEKELIGIIILNIGRESTKH